ncbi:hypothetical protein DCE79_15615 [Lysinibacillus sp. 2017]|nr:hypothetical protein DCE79_15615 [Lysinibacillus sp. 2017]
MEKNIYKQSERKFLKLLKVENSERMLDQRKEESILFYRKYLQLIIIVTNHVRKNWTAKNP